MKKRLDQPFEKNPRESNECPLAATFLEKNRRIFDQLEQQFHAMDLPASALERVLRLPGKYLRKSERRRGGKA
jgi:hypothetical protein